MQSNPNNTFVNLWPQYWPRIILVLIGIGQMILAWIILGLHCGIVYLAIAEACSPVTARHVLGFICWGFFITSSIAACCISCCNRASFACATYGLIQNTITFIFSCVMIDFDRKFIDNPAYDYDLDISSSSWYDCIMSGNVNDIADARSTSLSLSKAQLSAAVFMLISSIVYMAIYIYTLIRSLMASNNRPIMNVFRFSGTNNTQPMVMVPPETHMSYPHQPGQHMPYPQQPLPKQVAQPGFYMQTQPMPGYLQQHQPTGAFNQYATNNPYPPPRSQDAQTGSPQVDKRIHHNSAVHVQANTF